jgi:hypothetical protein
MKKLLLITLAFLPTLLFAQQKPSLPYVASDAPEWIKMLTAENPNVFEIQKAYTQYFEEQPFPAPSGVQTMNFDKTLPCPPRKSQAQRRACVF